MELNTRAGYFRIALTGLAICISCFLSSRSFGQMHPVAKESDVQFSLHNFGFKTGGKMDPPEGEIWFNPDELSKSSFRVTIRVESINTDNESRDEHLRGEDYFDIKNHPLIRFVSSSVRSAGAAGNFEAAGTLTIKNTSKEVSLPFTAEKKGNGYFFTGSFKLNRKDYGIGGSSTLSNDVSVEIKVLAQ